MILLIEKIKLFFFKKDTDNSSFLIFLRIATGLFLILELLSVWKDFEKLYGKYGIIPYDIIEIQTSDYVISLTKVITYFEKYSIDQIFIINIFLILFILFSLFLIIGFFTRFSAFVLLFLYVMSFSNTYYIYGIDKFVITTLFYLSLFPTGRYYSVDNILFKRKNLPKINLTPYRRLLQLNVCIVYFFAGISKSFGETWWNGEAIWKSMNLLSANQLFRLDLAWLADYPFLLVLMGWGVLAIEILYPVFIWIPKTRKLWLSLTISMHVGIILVLNLYLFGVFMIIWNLSAFYFISDNTHFKKEIFDKKIILSRPKIL